MDFCDKLDQAFRLKPLIKTVVLVTPPLVTPPLPPTPATTPVPVDEPVTDCHRYHRFWMVSFFIGLVCVITGIRHKV